MLWFWALIASFTMITNLSAFEVLNGFQETAQPSVKQTALHTSDMASPQETIENKRRAGQTQKEKESEHLLFFRTTDITRMPK